MTLLRGKISIVGVVAVAALIIGFSAAASADSTSRTTPSTRGALPVQTSGSDPGYKRNASGETYGSLADATSPDQEPDLIAVKMSTGKTGYVKKKDLDTPKFTNPEDSVKWSEENSGKTRVLTVYESDGKTAIGTFILDPSVPGNVQMPPR